MSFMDKTTTTTTGTDYTFDLGGQHSTTGIYGWICPVCGRGVAPDQKYCDCKPRVYPVYPTYPYWWYQTTCSTAGSTPDASTVYTSDSISTKVEV